MRNGAKMVFFKIYGMYQNRLEVVEGTEVESYLQKVRTNAMASQRKATHKIGTPVLCRKSCTLCPSTTTGVIQEILSRPTGMPARWTGPSRRVRGRAAALGAWNIRISSVSWMGAAGSHRVARDGRSAADLS